MYRREKRGNALLFQWDFPRFLVFLATSLLAGSVFAASPLTNEPITPLHPLVGINPQHAALGDRLFHDRRLSRDDTVSCASCHVLEKGGADTRRYSVGVAGAVGTINAPTVYNSSFNFMQRWEGRDGSLEEQVDGPVHSPLEMATDWRRVLAKLRRDPALLKQFESAYEDGLTVSNIRNAIATFERSLTTPDSPFDRYLLGDEQAIRPAAKEGYLLFKRYGCASCHQGAAVGGNMFQQMGAMGDYFADRGQITPADLGRYNVTGDERDRHVFKVPSLRLVVFTAPYFHDGSAATLDRAIEVMARYQLGRSIPFRERTDIAAFLESLAGYNPRLKGNKR